MTVDAGPAPWSRPYQGVEPDLLAEVHDRSNSQRGMWGVELLDPDVLDVVADVALCVVEVEGPAEKEVIYTRVRLAWGLGRAGQVVRDRIVRALRRLLKQGKIVHGGTAYDRPGRETEFARTPTERAPDEWRRFLRRSGSSCFATWSTKDRACTARTCCGRLLASSDGRGSAPISGKR
ncbi:DUF3320 domain-containing protein [Streptomyces chartreusis]|uniref:DUF3320 domain-containing protein n=1 Tax=Streptomyces chartreusis TaxID=1969 RepID=UPI00142F245F|nr:DUF3320 domain-containing protein [Streptomyces chartreusis]